LAPGVHSYTWNTTSYTNGTYLIGLTSDGQQVTQKVVVQK
jgi:hypothetical protein